jgi:hypothetical protein
VVEDRQRERLQDHRLGEVRLDDEDRRPGEVQVALGVAPDVPGEPVGGQPRGGRLVHDALGGEELQRGPVEPEGLQGVQEAPGPGHDAVPAADRQMARENLEHRPARRGAAGERSAQHGEFVAVGQQSRRRKIHEWQITVKVCTMIEGSYR